MIMCTPAWVSSTCLGFFLAADLCLDACGGGGEHQRPLGGTSTPAPFCPALSCLFCPALSCPVLSYPALPRPALPCPALPHPVLFYPSLSCPACMTHDACAAYCFPQARCSPCFESCLRHQSPTLPAPPPRPPLRPPPLASAGLPCGLPSWSATPSSRPSSSTRSPARRWSGRGWCTTSEQGGWCVLSDHD